MDIIYPWKLNTFLSIYKCVGDLRLLTWNKIFVIWVLAANIQRDVSIFVVWVKQRNKACCLNVNNNSFCGIEYATSLWLQHMLPEIRLWLSKSDALPKGNLKDAQLCKTVDILKLSTWVVEGTVQLLWVSMEYLS